MCFHTMILFICGHTVVQINPSSYYCVPSRPCGVGPYNPLQSVSSAGYCEGCILAIAEQHRERARARFEPPELSRRSTHFADESTAPRFEYRSTSPRHEHRRTCSHRQESHQNPEREHASRPQYRESTRRAAHFAEGRTSPRYEHRRSSSHRQESRRAPDYEPASRPQHEGDARRESHQHQPEASQAQQPSHRRHRRPRGDTTPRRQHQRAPPPPAPSPPPYPRQAPPRHHPPPPPPPPQARILTPTPDYHAVLGVPRDADNAAIKAAYRKLLLACHPDKLTAAGESEKAAAAARFLEVQEAYNSLRR